MDQVYDYILSQIPESIDFNFITVKYESERTFYLNNISDTSILFRIETSTSYIFEPSNGVISKSQKIPIKLKINPSEATVLVSNAKITLDNKRSKILKMSLISKYPYLRINTPSLNFGTIQIGKCAEIQMIISNPEAVPAKFTISKQSVQPGKHIEVFTFSSTSGEVPANSSYLLTVIYKPFFPNSTSIDNYVLQTLSGNSNLFTCNGSCSPINAWFASKRVNFKSIQLGSKMTKMLRIYNDGEFATEYQIYHDNSGAFTIDNPQGIIPRRSNLRINITFRPYETIVYYERMFCLVRNHIVLILDVYGSCYDLLTKVPLLEGKSIEMFRMKMLKGVFFGKNNRKVKEAEEIESLVKTNENKSIYTEANEDEELLNYEITQTQTQVHKEMFWEITSKNRLFSFDTEHIDFNFVPCGETSEPYILHLYNNSNENIKIKWIYDKPVNTSNLLDNANIFNVDSTVFFVQPEEKIINKKSNSEFKVYFKPNKNEYYFYSDLPCQGTIIPSSKKNVNINVAVSTNMQLKGINKSKLTETGKNILTQSQPNNDFKLKHFKIKKSSLLKSLTLSKKGQYDDQSKNEEIEYPPISIKLSMVGHSFPPGRQIFMPIYEMRPKKELFFPSTSINQSLYQSVRIQNKSDTPLFYKLSTDPMGIFKVHRKYGLIPSNDFHLICIEFCPKDTTVYRFPLRIIFNHDNTNMKTLILNGLCTDPVIKIEGLSNELYFPPSYVGIKTTKSIDISNLSPIKIFVNIKVEENETSIVDVIPNSFEMDINSIKKIVVSMLPKVNEMIMSKMIITAERVYDPHSEGVGIFNPRSSIEIKDSMSQFDKRTFTREITLLGRGANGEISIQPNQIEFGTVKVGFHKKMTFSIFNPTLTNFYIKLIPFNSDNTDFNQFDMISFDFSEGLINSFCKKEISIQFSPKSRISINFKINVYATNKIEENGLNVKDEVKELKCYINVNAKGDYPLIKIVDIRSESLSTSRLWERFNVESANDELQKQLTEEEINYMLNAQMDRKVQNNSNQLKCINFNFGRHIFDKKRTHHACDVYLTIKNEGGVTSEFYFKFPDDVAIKREIWMDPVEPSSNEKAEYQVVKEKIFEIEPRSHKLEPNETCNIRFRYNCKEQGDHRLRVIFQIVNGKPLIFELYGTCLEDSIGSLEVSNPILNFSYIPMGFMSYIASPIELVNTGAVKIKYVIDKDNINIYNKENGDVEIFKAEKCNGIINPFERAYLVLFFRPVTDTHYKMTFELRYTDDEKTFHKKMLTVEGTGYHPMKFVPPEYHTPFIPNHIMCNNYAGNTIRLCGLSLETIDFGTLLDKPKSETVILYNYSNTNSFNFDFAECGFLVNDNLMIIPNKGVLEPNSHILIKFILFPSTQASNYNGDIQINIIWNSIMHQQTKNSINQEIENTKVPMGSRGIKREKLFIRISKKSHLKDRINLLESTYNPNLSFVESMLNDVVREAFSDKKYENFLLNNFDKQPMGLYSWTNDVMCPIQEYTRKQFINNTKKKTQEELNFVPGRKSVIAKLDAKKGFQPPENSPRENVQYGEEDANVIDDKYMGELITKYKMSVPEVNERLILINEDTRKMVSNTVMEDTIYGMISEAVYGETDLTEKPRIYFFLNKEK